MTTLMKLFTRPSESTFNSVPLSLLRTGLKRLSQRRAPAVTKTPTPALITHSASAHTFTVRELSASLFPAISIIIPMYNAEKYIGECIESILNQTFKDFELIIVDDCSKDNSFAVVESYIPKSGGRLKLSRLDKNSGGAPAPRNKGIKIARGEYFFFMDADDALMPTALEKLYTTAKEFDADVVHCEKWYSSPGESASTDENVLKISSKNMVDIIEEPTVDTNVLSERITKFTQYRLWWAPWSHLIRRKLMLDNGVTFPKLNIADDFVFTVFIYCLAEKFVTIPGAFYVWRILENSNCHIDLTNTPIERVLHRRVNDVFLGIQTLDAFTSKFKLFQDEPNYKYDLINFFVQAQINNLYELYNQFPVATFDKFIRKEFIEIGNDPVIAAFLFNRMMIVDENAIVNQQKHKAIVDRFTARLDIRFMSEADFQIFDISDAKAKLIKPNWLRYAGGWGYMLASYAGEMEFVIKTVADGRIELILRGMDIREPEDESKRIPYWIDYTALIVNGKTIFDTVTPVWHDEPYFCNINAKANEDIKVKIEWLPHKKTLSTPRPAPQLPKETNDFPNARIDFKALSTTLNAFQVPDKFKDFLTARIDVKLLSEGDLQILNVADNKATIRKPDWFQKDGIGYQIQSYAGEMEFVAKAKTDGEFCIWLMGLDVRMPEDKSKRVPHWIDYTTLVVNDQTIFDVITPACHDEPYFYSINAKADEDIKVKIEWLPHKKALSAPRNVFQAPDKFKNFLTARIDVKLEAEGDFQILNISDDKATIWKPAWFQKDGTGYQIQSYAGKLAFVAKAAVDGRIRLNLLGLYMRNPKNTSKRIPYWIDYTKLIVNGKEILNTLTPVWHDKPYIYNIDAKANEELKIQVEWLPHRSDT